jgi:hypothetical protein
MSDEETGSWWQQVTGECILGPLKGKRLRRISSDEVTLESWRAERPESTAVKFEMRHLTEYPPSDWEPRIAKLTRAHDLIVGIELDGASAAFPLAQLREQNPRNAQVGRTPIVLIVGPDGNSVRSFIRPTVEANPLEFFRRPADGILIDSATGSMWTFAGKAIAGPLAGRALDPVQNTKDYWFDWSSPHPNPSVSAGDR